MLVSPTATSAGITQSINNQTNSEIIANYANVYVTSRDHGLYVYVRTLLIESRRNIVVIRTKVGNELGVRSLSAHLLHNTGGNAPTTTRATLIQLCESDGKVSFMRPFLMLGKATFDKTYKCILKVLGR